MLDVQCTNIYTNVRKYIRRRSLNLKGNPKWNPQTAFRALCTTVQIAAWSPNRTRALIITPVPSWYIPEAGCQNDKLCTQQLPTMGLQCRSGHRKVIPVFRGWPLAGTTSQTPDAWSWLSLAEQQHQLHHLQGRL